MLWYSPFAFVPLLASGASFERREINQWGKKSPETPPKLQCLVRVFWFDWASLRQVQSVSVHICARRSAHGQLDGVV